jgi:hypothetical protein
VLLRSGTRRVDPEEKKQIDHQYEVFQKAWKQRKKICVEILDAITENLPQSPSEFIEELGLELDPPNDK